MGGCALVSRKRENNIEISLISIYSVDYKSNSIIKYSQNDTIERISISCGESLPKYSAYSYKSPYIYIVGGTDSETPLRNDVIRINIEQLYLEYLASLPIGSKHGEIYIHYDYIYYVGGAHLENYSIAPTPFLRLLQDSLSWEFVSEIMQVGLNTNISYQLLRPGSCKLNNCIYFIGGELLSKPIERNLNKHVYCFDLDTLTINALEYEGISIVAPKCINNNGSIIVLGGYINKGNNYDISIIGKNPIKINDTGLRVSINKPLHKIPGFFLIIGNNKLKKLREDRMTWKIENILKESIKEAGEIKNITNRKRVSKAPLKKSILSQYYEDTEKSLNLEQIRQESRKLSPSNLFNSQIDFDYSQTFQIMPHKELSGINSIIENYELKW